MVSAWFPRPTSEAHLEVLRPGGLAVSALLAFLNDPAGNEWKHKVGVAGRRDGSAKVTTRLLESNGWVFKTDQARRLEDRDSVLRELQRTLEIAQQFSQRELLWHPDKVWFVAYVEPFYWPMTACPTMTTLRELPSRQERFAAWTQMILVGLRMSETYGLGLDLNPSNFGMVPGQSALYYLDDETYPVLSPNDLGAVIAARIPEEPEVLEPVWREWGQTLQQELLAHWDAKNPAWRRLIEGIEDWLLTRMFYTRREALIDGLRPTRAKQTVTVARPQPRLTAVFGDIHGNRLALEAMLAAAREFGVDSWLCLGDLVGYGPNPRECVELIAALPNCTRLVGNHDIMVAGDDVVEGVNRYARESILWSRTQLSPQWRRWLVEAPLDHLQNEWLAVHGAPLDPRRVYAYVYELTYRENLAWLKERNYRLCFYGHTHVAFVHRMEEQRVEQLTPKELRVLVPGQTLLVNPGSVGQPRDGDPRTAFAIWDRRTNMLTFHRVEYAVDQVMATIRAMGLPEDLAARLEIGR